MNTCLFPSRAMSAVAVTLIFLAAVVSCGAQDSEVGNTKARHDGSSPTHSNAVERVADESGQVSPSAPTSTVESIQSEFLALPRPLVLRYERQPGRIRSEPSKHGLPIPPSVRATVTKETIAFVKQHAIRDLVDGLMPIMTDPRSEYAGDACVVITVALGNSAWALGATEYRSPTVKGKWDSLGIAAVEDAKREWDWRRRFAKPSIATNDVAKPAASPIEFLRR